MTCWLAWVAEPHTFYITRCAPPCTPVVYIHSTNRTQNYFYDIGLTFVGLIFKMLVTNDFNDDSRLKLGEGVRVRCFMVSFRRDGISSSASLLLILLDIMADDDLDITDLDIAFFNLPLFNSVYLSTCTGTDFPLLLTALDVVNVGSLFDNFIRLLLVFDFSLALFCNDVCGFRLLELNGDVFFLFL